ncbi:MAG: addiction module protein [Burkholderiales bacterium]
MPDQVTELAERGKALSAEERSRLVDLLLESLHEPAIAQVQAAWEVEIERRLTEYDRGEVQAIDAEEVFAKARSIAR